MKYLKYLPAMLLLISPQAMAADEPWNSMIVYSGGQVITNQFKTERLCREAISFVQYGMSIEEKIKVDAAAYERAAKAAKEYEVKVAEWRVAHPCVTKAEDKGEKYEHCSMPNGGERLYNSKGKLISEYGPTIGSSGMIITFGSSNYITHAVCFQ